MQKNQPKLSHFLVKSVSLSLVRKMQPTVSQFSFFISSLLCSNSSFPSRRILQPMKLKLAWNEKKKMNEVPSALDGSTCPG